jgi:peptide-methionine (S)-S-oxide reductase
MLPMKKLLLLAALAAALLSFTGAAPAPPQYAHATFAGGCFWCMVHPFDSVNGVIKVTSGYTGGTTRNPTYEEVSSGTTGHRESVDVVYDPRKVSYQRLLDIFWHNVDPTNGQGQFCDYGEQYQSAIYYHDAAQQQLAEASKKVVEAKLKRVYTNVLPASQFWPAEEYHQDYYKKNPVRYKFYRFNCGRDQKLESIWGKAPSH